MRIRTSLLPLTKRFALTISRGTSAGSENLIVEVEHEGVTGIGEMSPVNIGDGQEDAAAAQQDIARWAEELVAVSPWEMQRVELVIDRLGGGRAARAGLDFALHDWLGKRTAMPLYRLLGADMAAIVTTSLTIGINAPEIARERTIEIMSRLRPRALKVKLGDQAGIEADQAMFEAVREVVPDDVAIRVDANGGWDVLCARRMIAWLAERGVEYVEQPLPLGQEEDLPAVHRGAALPLFADESCRTSSDVPKLADRVDGVNLKLMKAGGIREGLRVIHTARAYGIKVMMGCMSESSLAIAASVGIAAYADFLDLDSHLNLLPDPFTGLQWIDGRVLPSQQIGLGVTRIDD